MAKFFIDGEFEKKYFMGVSEIFAFKPSLLKTRLRLYSIKLNSESTSEVRNREFYCIAL